jgi:cell wall-associated NlpC family hydrolase
MKKHGWLCLGAAAAVCVVGASYLYTGASETLDVESAMAGVAVDLNNYYASSLNPESELRDFLNSDLFTQEETNQEENPEESAEAESQSTQESTAETEETTEAPTEAETQPEKTSPYANVAVSRVREGSYVNVRTEPNTSSEVLGKLYNDCAATILDTVAGEDGDWYEIKSGSVRGYIKAEYFITGDEAEARAIEIGKLEGYVNTNGLRLRSEPNLDSQILTLLYSGETYQVLEVGDEFVKVQVDDEIGYVYGEMIDVSVKFDTAISLEEEKAKEEEEARKKAEAAAAAKKLEEAKKAAAAAAAAESAAAANQSSQSEASGSSTTQETTAAVSTTTTSVSSASRDALVSYAKQWVGVTPYVYGGTSLTTGADCSGFIQACYANALGMSVPRDSRSQASGGTEISESELQPGDLVFYNGGGSTINHVAMYIGGGQVVHASNASVGTIISNMKYREPCKYVRYIN